METIFFLGESEGRPHTATAGRNTPSLRNTCDKGGERQSAQKCHHRTSGQRGQAPGSDPRAGQSPRTMRNRVQGHLHKEHGRRGRA